MSAYLIYPSNPPAQLKLSAEQKMQAYVWAKDNFRTCYGGPYLCNVLIQWLVGGSQYSIFHYPHVMDLFPELLEQRPADWVKGPWWCSMNTHNDNIDREIALQTAIFKLQGIEL